MIFITVGTSNKGFDRLLKACDSIAQSTELHFFAQTGSSNYIPTFFKSQHWLTPLEIQEYYSRSSAFIIHGGFGTISEIIRLGKPIIVVPRSSTQNEAVNDQMDLAMKLDRLGFVKCIKDLKDLEDTILDFKSVSFNKYNLKTIIPGLITSFVNNLELKVK